MSRLITAAEREARRHSQTLASQNSASADQPRPIAQFRVKGGCKTCKPIPVFVRPQMQPPTSQPDV